MPDQDSNIKSRLCNAMKELYSQGFLTDIGGNVSCRAADEESIWISPSGIRKNQVNPEDLVKVSLDGATLEESEGKKHPSVELKLHLAIYEEDEDYNAVVHSHGPYATAFSIAPMEIPPLTDETQILVPNLKNSLVSYAPRGSAELASAVSEIITDSSIAIIQNHGLFTAATTLEHAIILTRAVEENIRLYCLAKQIGGELSVLPD
ncbi:MAG: class II aldolase/adducin family protein [Candidatus Hodarchaeales archaeon]|jgi:L-fuculose-phosphate aldolase